MSVDLTTVKTRQQQAWSAGNYAKAGNYLVIVGEELCEAVDVRAGQRVLDVAPLAAASRRWQPRGVSAERPASTMCRR